MEIKFPCKNHDLEKDWNVWCKDMMNDKNFACPNKVECMCLVEDEIERVLRESKPQKISYKLENQEVVKTKNQEEINQKTKEEINHVLIPEFQLN